MAAPAHTAQLRAVATAIANACGARRGKAPVANLEELPSDLSAQFLDEAAAALAALDRQDPDDLVRLAQAELLQLQIGTYSRRSRSIIEQLCVVVSRLRAWVSDLSAGVYVNCVYCGHRYGPAQTTPVAMAEVLKAHVAECPEHPMSSVVDALRDLNAAIDVASESLCIETAMGSTQLAKARAAAEGVLGKVDKARAAAADVQPQLQPVRAP